MKNHRGYIILICAVAVSLLVGCSTGNTNENIRRLRVCMSRAETIAVMGSPGSTEQSSAREEKLTYHIPRAPTYVAIHPSQIPAQTFAPGASRERPMGGLMRGRTPEFEPSQRRQVLTLDSSCASRTDHFHRTSEIL